MVVEQCTDVHVALQLQHLLFGDVVGNHPLGGALGSQLGQIPVLRTVADIILFQNIDQFGEGRGDPDALFILDAFVALAQGLVSIPPSVCPVFSSPSGICIL